MPSLDLPSKKSLFFASQKKKKKKAVWQEREERGCNCNRTHIHEFGKFTFQYERKRK